MGNVGNKEDEAYEEQRMARLSVVGTTAPTGDEPEKCQGRGRRILPVAVMTTVPMGNAATPAAKSRLESCPPEVQMRICSSLNGNDVASLRQVSRQCNEIASRFLIKSVKIGLRYSTLNAAIKINQHSFIYQGVTEIIFDLNQYKNTRGEAGLNYSSAIQDVLIKEIKRCTDKTKMEQLMNASFNLDRAWTTKAAWTLSAGWKLVHDWEDEQAYNFGRGMYEKLYNQQKDISKNQTHVWILAYILQRFPVVNTLRFQSQNPAPRESITKDGEGNRWPYCMDLHPRSSFGSKGYTEIHMGDLINCFYQCK